jgi:hypothetical protein
VEHRFLAPIGALGTVVALGLLTQIPAAGQQASAPAKKTATAKAAVSVPTKSAASRTPWGDPDLQGVYTFATTTPIERPKALGFRAFYTQEEQVALAKKTEDEFAAENLPVRQGDVGTYNNFWVSSDKGKLTGRTSLITDPEDGRMPPFTERAQKIREKWAADATARQVFVGSACGSQQAQVASNPERDALEFSPCVLFNSWADHPTYTRCIARAMPRMWQSYNHGVQIVQTPGYVVLDYESMHDVRIIPLDGSPHLDANIQQYDGDSRGHWDGDTLVVDLANLNDKMEFPDHIPGAPEGNMHIVERFTRVDANTVNYQVTVDDPTTWTRPWTFVLPWRSDDPGYQHPEDLFEYACHEGNFRMMEDTLVGSRALKEETPRTSTKQ